MIKIENLKKSYDGVTIIKDCNAIIKEGYINGLVGENGAGKSTLLRLIAGVLTPDSGTITVDGEPVYENPEVKGQIFFLSDDPFYGKTASLKSLCTLYSSFFKGFTKEEFKKHLIRYNIDIDKPLNSFSKGMRRKSYICAALASKASIILIDEAFDGLDPLSRQQFKKDVIDLVLENPETTVVIASHSLRELEDICDSYCLVDNGSISEDFMNKRDSNLLKVRLAFEEAIFFDSTPLKPVFHTDEGRFQTLIVETTEEEVKEFFKPLKPAIMDITPLTLEEAFIYKKERDLL